MTGAAGLTGVGIAVVSAASYDVGYVLEKRALDGIGPTSGVVDMLRRAAATPLWVAGFASMLVGLFLQVMALSVAPVSLVQPVLAGGLVALAAVGPRLLGERLSGREKAALVAVLVSVAAAALSAGSGGGAVRTVDGSRFAVLAMIVALAAAAVWRMGHGAVDLLTSAVPAGLMYGLGAVAEKAVATRIHDSGLLSGALGSLRTPYPWLFVVATVAGLVAFQVGLASRPASLMAAVTNVVSTGTALAGAAAVFADPLVPGGWSGVARFVALLGLATAFSLLGRSERLAAGVG